MGKITFDEVYDIMYNKETLKRIKNADIKCKEKLKNMNKQYILDLITERKIEESRPLSYYTKEFQGKEET